MFKRIKRINDRINAGRDAATPSSSSRGHASFSMRTALVREMVIRVGKGEAASSVQQVAQAAVEEAGPEHVTARNMSSILKFFGVTTTML